MKIPSKKKETNLRVLSKFCFKLFIFIEMDAFVIQGYFNVLLWQRIIVSLFMLNL